ncbi:MAG: hypothetical protein WCT27_05120 [Patescibacteria group bacterium]
MEINNFKQLIQNIVQRGTELKNKHTTDTNAVVNYSCIFTHSDQEYQLLDTEAQSLGSEVKSTEMGKVYLLHEAIETVAGPLRIVKVRKPDPKRPEQGDADFTLADYQAFKKAHLNEPGYKLITRPEMEMIELADKDFDVLAYFSHPTLAEVLGMELVK